MVYKLDIWRPEVYSIPWECGGVYSGETGGVIKNRFSKYTITFSFIH